MENSKIKLILIILPLIAVISFFPTIVNADMGEKPSITVKIKNISTNNYIIDLLVYDENGKNYHSEMNYNGEDLNDKQIQQLYDINYDGWISESTRWDAYLLFSDCKGNNGKTHVFSYFGVPTKYKILIINNDTNDIKVSEEITRTDFSSQVSIDYNNMNVIENIKSINIKNFIFILIITIIFEVIIAFIMNLRKNMGLIVLINFITNIILQILLFITPFNFLAKLLVLEFLVIIGEYLIYKKNIKDQSKTKILLYTLIANLVTMSLTFFIK